MTRFIAAVALFACMASGGCVLSIVGRMEREYHPDPAGSVAPYPSVPAAGELITGEPLNPLCYLLVAVDLPLSLILDTVLLPYDLTHPIPPLPRPKVLTTRPVRE